MEASTYNLDDLNNKKLHRLHSVNKIMTTPYLKRVSVCVSASTSLSPFDEKAYFSIEPS